MMKGVQSIFWELDFVWLYENRGIGNTQMREVYNQSEKSPAALSKQTDRNQTLQEGAIKQTKSREPLSHFTAGTYIFTINTNPD